MTVTNWRKASYSSGNGGNCVEAGNTGRIVAVRDTKQQGQSRRDVLRFAPDAWQAFTQTIKSDLQPASRGGHPPRAAVPAFLCPG